MFGCCCCNLGAYVPRLKNVTQVRTQSDCTDPTTNATVTADGVNIPAARLDETYDANPGGARVCSGGAKCGKCGGWLQIGDYNGLPAQEVTPGTDDIVAGATPDATHYSVDNNSYQAYPSAAASFFQVGDIAQIVTIGTTDWTAMGASANTVGLIFTVTATGSGSGTAQLMTDMLMARRRGGQWIFAQKYWHGRPGFFTCDSNSDPTTTANQTKYLKSARRAGFSTGSATITGYNATSGSPPVQINDPLTDIYGNSFTPSDVFNLSADFSIGADYEVGRTTGISTQTYIGNAAAMPVNYQTNYGSAMAYVPGSVGGYVQTTSLATPTSLFTFTGNFPINLVTGFVTVPAACWNMGAISGFPTIDNENYSLAYFGGNVFTAMSVLIPVFAGLCNQLALADAFCSVISVPAAYPLESGFSGSASDLETAVIAAITNAIVTTNIAPTPAITCAVTFTDTGISGVFALGGFTEIKLGWAQTVSSGMSGSFSVTLSKPYTAADCVSDFEAALAAWDMSDFKRLNSLRIDENLAHAALCTYAEWQGAVVPPTDLFTTMNNYASPIADSNGYAPWTYDPLLYVPNTSTPLPTNYGTWTPVSGQGADWTPTWAQITWHDPNDFIWQTQALPAHGIYFTDPTTVGLVPANFTDANLRTGIYDGSIIAHTKPIDPATSQSIGICDRHFWFNAVTYRREPQIDQFGNPTGLSYWFPYSHGAYSDDSGFTDSTTENPAGTYFDGQLPTPTMRWMPPQNEKYDGLAAGTPNIGNFPQQFTDFSNGCLKGGKYCQAVQKWNAVDYLQPSGQRKFDVDQTTVGIIVAAGSGYFTVGKPTTTGAFPATGYIAVTGSIGVTGIYPVTGAATDNGDNTWNVPVGAKIEDFPTGVFTYGDQRDNVNWLGWLKWVGYTQYAQTFASAPGITGRVAVTTSYAAGVLTVNTTAAQPYFRKGSDTALRAVNLYDAGGTLLNGSPLVLARVSTSDDNHFTATTSNYPTAVWMVDAALTWAQSGFTNASQNTGVHIKWQFDQRKANLATAAQPAWLNGTGAGVGDGVVGCLDSGYSIEQFNYLNGSCPAIVGIVPSGSPENFGTQVLFDFPTVPIDNGYGAHSQSFIGLTMEDPFEIACGTPFKPDFNPMDYTTPLSFSWKEDDGSGKSDDGGATPPVYYYAMRPLVEAADAVPSGKSLPIGVTLFFDPANKFPPPCYPNGILYGATVTSDWKTTERICNNVSRFVADYAAWSFCP